MVVVRRILANLFILGCIALLLTGVYKLGVAGFGQEALLTSCLNEIEKQPDSSREQRQSVNAPAAASPGEQKDPATRRQEVRKATEERAKVAFVCKGLGIDAGTALARASYDLSFLGYVATLLFGTLGVIGIFLSYTASRDARDDARQQAAAAAGGSAVGGSGGGGSAGTGGGGPAAP